MRRCIVPARHMTCMTPGPYPLCATSSPRTRVSAASTSTTPSGLATPPGDLSLSLLTHLSIRTLDPLERSVLVVPTDDGSLDCLSHTNAASSCPLPMPPAVRYPTRRTAPFASSTSTIVCMGPRLNKPLVNNNDRRLPLVHLPALRA
jgi:hypothetical protein